MYRIIWQAESEELREEANGEYESKEEAQKVAKKFKTPYTIEKII